jgi:hypothetical protein
MLLFLILCMLGLGYLGLGERANLIVAIVLIALGVFLVFAGWDGSFAVRAN